MTKIIDAKARQKDNQRNLWSIFLNFIPQEARCLAKDFQNTGKILAQLRERENRKNPGTEKSLFSRGFLRGCVMKSRASWRRRRVSQRLFASLIPACSGSTLTFTYLCIQCVQCDYLSEKAEIRKSRGRDERGTRKKSSSRSLHVFRKVVSSKNSISSDKYLKIHVYPEP